MIFRTPNPVAREDDLLRWVEHSNPSVFRKQILKSMHKNRLIEFNEAVGQVRISPTGIAYVEENLPLEITALEAA